MNRKVLILIGLVFGLSLIGWLSFRSSSVEPMTSPYPSVSQQIIQESSVPELSFEPKSSPKLSPASSPIFSSSPSVSSSPISGFKIISWEEIRRHNNSQSCYTVIRGYVYDLTNFMPIHGGGEEAIQKICGRDGSDDFVEQHGGSPKQENLLEKMKIGKIQ